MPGVPEFVPTQAGEPLRVLGRGVRSGKVCKCYTGLQGGLYVAWGEQSCARSVREVLGVCTVPEVSPQDAGAVRPP